jgi:hypothetical protein
MAKALFRGFIVINFISYWLLFGFSCLLLSASRPDGTRMFVKFHICLLCLCLNMLVSSLQILISYLSIWLLKLQSTMRNAAMTAKKILCVLCGYIISYGYFSSSVPHDIITFRFYSSCLFYH